MKKQKGITLIALIITIIVLLILAGVSISLVVGQNGILEKSQEAVTETKKASIEEQIQLAWAACETEFIVNSKAQNRSKYFDISDLNQNLSQGEIIAVSTGVNAQEDNQLVYKLDDIYYKIQVTKSGEVNILGESSAKPEKLSLASQIGKSNYGDYVKYEVDLGIATAENNELSDNTAPKTDWRYSMKMKRMCI